MFAENLKYIFWVLMALPVLALGIYFFVNLINEIYTMFKADEKIRKEKELQKQKRREFEESYSRRRGGRV